MPSLEDLTKCFKERSKEECLSPYIAVDKKRKQVIVSSQIRSFNRFVQEGEHEGEHAEGIFEIEDFIFDSAVGLLNEEGVLADKDSFIAGLIYAQQYTRAEPNFVGEFVQHVNREIMDHIEGRKFELIE